MDALHKKGNTLGVAPTGSGKTIMLSAVVGDVLNDSGGKACILAHRDEITAQNIDKFVKEKPYMSVGAVFVTGLTLGILAVLAARGKD